MRFTHEIVDAYLQKRTYTPARIPEPVDITIKAAFAPTLSFLLDFVRPFVVIVVYRDHVGSYPVLAVGGENLAFPSLPSLDPLATFRQKFSNS